MTSESAEDMVGLSWGVFFSGIQFCMTPVVFLALLIHGAGFWTSLAMAASVGIFGVVILPVMGFLGEADVVGAAGAVATAFYCACIVNAIYFHFMAARLPIEEGLATMEQTKELEGRKKLAREKTKVRALCITLAVVCAFCLWWGWSKGNAGEAALEKQYSQGVKDGEAKHEADYQNGYDLGHQEGQEDGWSDGRQGAYETGYADGHLGGYDEGSFDGYESGYVDGYDDAVKGEPNFYENDAPAVDENTVYISDQGTKYHKMFCQYVTANSHPVNIDDAKSKGYTAGSKCF